MTQLNALQVAETAWYGGFWGSDLIIAVAVARGESDWRTDARLTTSQEDRTGLWQINTYAHPQYKKQSLLDPDYNAQPAFDVFHGAGYRWTPWTVYTRGIYLQFMDAARSGVNQLASMGNNVSGPAPGGQRTGVGAAPPTAVEGVGSADSSQAVWAVNGAWNDGWLAFGGYTGAMESLIGL